MDADDQPRPTDSDIEALRSACEESRAVLDQEIAVLNDIDDAAVWTVRIAAILIGFVVSAASVASSQAVSPLSTTVRIVTGAGVVTLLLAIFAGIATYSISMPNPGIGHEYRAEVLNEAYTEREWRVLLLEGYQQWIAEMQQENRKHGLYLAVTQLLLLTGAILLAAAGGLTVWGL